MSRGPKVSRGIFECPDKALPTSLGHESSNQTGQPESMNFLKNQEQSVITRLGRPKHNSRPLISQKE